MRGDEHEGLRLASRFPLDPKVVQSQEALQEVSRRLVAGYHDGRRRVGANTAHGLWVLCDPDSHVPGQGVLATALYFSLCVHEAL